MCPPSFLKNKTLLGLILFDLNILLQLARHWWYSDNPPHPSKAAIAKCMRVDRSTVRRHIARMEHDGLIEREKRFDAQVGRQEPNAYHFSGLIAAATKHAIDFLALRDKQQMEQETRRNRKKPGLVKSYERVHADG